MGRLAAATATAALTAAALVGGPTTSDAAPATSCAPVEVTIDHVPPASNPFDPAELTVTATFTGPNGLTITTRGFWAVDHTRSLDDGVEHLVPTGEPSWRARVTPPASGPWSWTATASVSGGQPATVDAATFTCDPELDGREHGPLRRSPSDPTRLAWGDDTQYFAVGENLAWYSEGGTYDYDHWLDALAQHGATWIRLFTPSWALGIEWGHLGDYRDRMDRAWQLDHVVEAARARGIAVQIVLNNPEWDGSPYNAANGGPLHARNEFFTNPTAREMFKRRLSYITARWAAIRTSSGSSGTKSTSRSHHRPTWSSGTARWLHGSTRPNPCGIS